MNVYEIACDLLKCLQKMDFSAGGLGLALGIKIGTGQVPGNMNSGKNTKMIFHDFDSN